MNRTPLAMTIGLIAVLGLLTACAGGSTSSSASPAPSGPASAPASEPSSVPTGAMPGSDPGSWSPVQVTPDMNGKVIDLVVGQAVIFSGLESDPMTYTIESSDPDVMEPMQATDDGNVKTNAGAVAKSPGAARVLWWEGEPRSKDSVDGPVAAYVFQVFEKDLTGTGGPMLIDANTKEIELFPGQWAVLTNVPNEGAIIGSSDDMVVTWVPETGAMNPSVIAVGLGTATVTAMDKDGNVISNVKVTVKESTSAG